MRLKEIIKIGMLSIAVSTSVANATEQIQEETYLITNKKLSKIDKKINLSKKLIGEIEYNHFIKYFELEQETPEEIYSKIKEFTSDGILGPIALEKIYKKVYSKNLDNCSKDIKERWEVYLDMKKYNKHRSAKGDRPKLRNFINKGGVFSHEFYYGRNNLGHNIEGTDINEKLNGIIPNSIKYRGPEIIIENYEGKTTLSYYEKGILEIATYVSPGKLSTKSYSKKTFYKKGKVNKYYISSSSKRPGSIMPYGIHIAGGIWIHGSDHKITGFPESGGCLRTPSKFIKPLFEKIKKLKKHNLKIIIKNIY